MHLRGHTMRGAELLARLRDEVLIGDGALGTMLSEAGLGRGTCFERLNLSDPHVVRDVHAAYRAAGSQVIETNTFGANRTKLGQLRDARELEAIIAAGVELAREAAAGAFVAGAVGPLAQPTGDAGPRSDDDVKSLFREPILALANAGSDALVFETFSDLRQLLLALEVAKAETDLPAICQLAFHERGHTQSGASVRAALVALQNAGADVIGANCGRGVRCVAAAVREMCGASDSLISAYPNAGLPEFTDGRYLFGAPLPYLADSAAAMAADGANLIGGCCGTTPEYIRRIGERLAGRKPAMRVRVEVAIAVTVEDQPPAPATVPAHSLLHRLERPAPGRRPMVVVELDPPRGLNFELIVKRAQQLRDMGVDAITMADNPVAVLHMGNLALATIVQREADLPVILHLACRDHNLLGLQSRLLEAHALGVHHVLALTGDPARVGDQPGATSVYDTNSVGLVELVAKFNGGVHHGGTAIGGRTKFTIGVAFNPGANDRKLAHEMARLRKKVAAGAHFAMTQPIYDPARFAAMRAATADLGTPMFAGLMPLLSERNAEFVHNEVPGICLTDDVRARMRGLSGPAGRAVGNRICCELIDGMIDTADAFYLIPPQRFTEMAVDLVAHIYDRAPRARGATP